MPQREGPEGPTGATAHARPDAPTIPLAFERRAPHAMQVRAAELADALHRRRSVREFSTDPIPLQVVRDAIRAAGSAPSGANKQPWTFVLVTDPAIKSKIRAAAEEEERRFYGEDGAPPRASDDWLEDLEPFGTDASKPFLEAAPALIVVFAQHKAPDAGRHYYVKESVGLATGILLATLHLCGLATLTHTPSPMAFLADLLGRPKGERAFVLIPVGYPAEACRVPAIERKATSEILVEFAPPETRDALDPAC